MADKLSEDELSAIISQQIELAKHHDKHAREGSRDKAIDYYMGNMNKYVPPEENRSKVVSRDVADTIGWTLPQLLRAFLGSNRMAIAEPVGSEDEEFAKQATAGLNYVFLKDNDGEQIVYNATWNALLLANAPIKVFYDPTPVYATSFHSGLTEDQAALLLQGDDVEVLAQNQSEGVMQDEMGNQVPVVLYDLKIKRKKLDGTFVVDAIPPEEFLIDGEAINTEDAAFTDHWQQKTRSDLVQMGYDKADIWAIPEAARNDTAEEQARQHVFDAEATDKSMELVDYHECYIRVDVDGDGEAELVRACYAGNKTGKLLDWEVWEDEHPFEDIKCEPVPHRWDARSQADETIDIQDIKTVLSRQFLNNLYWVNNPMNFVEGSLTNPDMLASPVFGGTVFGKAGAKVSPLPIPFIGDKALLGLTHFDEVRQARTGVGRQSMALDADVLSNQTATASNNNKDASYTQVEQYARNMAAGWRKVFRKLLKLMVKHQEYSRKIMVAGKEVVIDPRFWNADMDITIDTGLGTGSRERDLATLGQVLQTQLLLADRFVSLGAMDEAIDLLPKIVETMQKMAEAAGIRNPEDFYPEYAEDKVAALKQMAEERASQPPPEVVIEKARAETQMALKDKDVEVSLQTAKIDAESDVVKNEAELAADLQTREADRQNALILEQQKAQHAFELDQERIKSAEAIRLAELQWERYKLDQTMQLERDKMANAAQIAAMKPKPDPGKPAAN